MNPNLKPFKPGQSGNPSGRPKLPELKNVLNAVLGTQDNGREPLQEIFNKLHRMSLKGNVKASELLLHYAFGRPQKSIQLDIEPIRVIMPKYPFKNDHEDNDNEDHEDND
jgi:hypothetical protein